MSALITVFGASGVQGGGLVRALLADPLRRFRVRAITRRTHAEAAQSLRRRGVEVIGADYDDPPSLRRALDGADAAFCVTNFWEHQDPERELRQARALAAATAAARTAHVVWSTLEDTRLLVVPGSGGMPVLQGRFNVPHFDAKGEANAAFSLQGVPTTFLYTSFYWDNLIHFGLHPRRGEDGRLHFDLPMEDALLPGIAGADIGACAFGIFARGAELVGKSIGIAGEHLSGRQMAEQLTLALGEPVVHRRLTPQQYAASGSAGAAELANMFQFKRDFARRYCESRSVTCARELHPGLLTFAAWLGAHRSQLQVAAPVMA